MIGGNKTSPKYKFNPLIIQQMMRILALMMNLTGSETLSPTKTILRRRRKSTRNSVLEDVIGGEIARKVAKTCFHVIWRRRIVIRGVRISVRGRKMMEWN
jgi:hypothetical protein